MKKEILFTLFASIGIVSMTAQDQLPSRSMTIEGTYNPKVTDATKISPVPQKNIITTNSLAVDYIEEAKDVEYSLNQPMTIYNPIDSTLTQKKSSGIVRLGYGLRNNVDGLLDFNWKPNDRDRFYLGGVLFGWNTDMPNDWDSKLLTSYARAGYSHIFDDVLIVSAKGGVGREIYNYRNGILMDPSSISKHDLDQGVTRGTVSVSLRSISNTDLSFSMEAGWYGLKRDHINVSESMKKNVENILRIEGSVIYDNSNEQKMGLSYKQKSAFYDWDGWTELPKYKFKNFTEFTFSPYIRWKNEKLEANLGFNLDARTAVGNTFWASPDMWFEYKMSPSVTLFSKIDGGIIDNEIRKINTISPYWSETAQIKDGYTIADLTFGSKLVFSPIIQVSAQGGIRFSKDEIFQVMNDRKLINSQIIQDDSRELYLKLGSDIYFSDDYNMNIDLRFTNWDTKKFTTALTLKPWLDLNVNAHAKIFGPLDASLQYRLSQFRMIGGDRAPMVNDLSLRLDYKLIDNVSLYADFQNVFNRKFYYYAGYQAQLFSGVIGATLRF